VVERKEGDGEAGTDQERETHQCAVSHHNEDVTVLVAGDVVAVAKRNVRDSENIDIGLAVAVGRL
jgi:hypothetical protein